MLMVVYCVVDFDYVCDEIVMLIDELIDGVLCVWCIV